MGQRIYTGGGYNGFRQMADRQRIQNRIVRDHGIVDDALFHTLLRDGYNGVAGGLRSGAAGGGQEHRFYLLAPLCRVLQQISNGIGGALENGT